MTYLPAGLPYPAMFLRVSALALALCLPALAQSSSAPEPSTAPAQSVGDPAAAEFEAVKKTELNIGRNGDEVIVSWVMPKIEVKGFEIFRNTRDQAPGRTRAATVRAEPPVFFDKVADAETTYWYWLKITLKDGQTVNIGPVRTPDAKVWTP